MTANFARGFCLPLVLLVAASGCTDRPKAPPLVHEAVYQNDKIGLRFLAPEGWSMSSRADLPSGKLPKPIILVAYQVSRGESPSELEVLVADLPEGSDLGKFLIDQRIGAAAWKLSPGIEKVTINGADATRIVLTTTETRVGKAGKTNKIEFRREATAFRRGERVYFFIVTFDATDPPARDAARQCVQSATWTK